jgi:hypothetical protein
MNVAEEGTHAPSVEQPISIGGPDAIREGCHFGSLHSAHGIVRNDYLEQREAITNGELFANATAEHLGNQGCIRGADATSITAL